MGGRYVLGFLADVQEKGEYRLSERTLESRVYANIASSDSTVIAL